MQESSIPQTTLQAPQADQTLYIPGSAEKKRALLMYLLIGIIGVLGTSQSKSVYEKYHFQQALGWWTISLACVVVSMVVLLIPVIRYIPIIIYVGLIVTLGIHIKQANDGKYTRNPQNILSVFVGLGGWVCDLFGIKI